MNVEQFEVFRIIAQVKSFTKAAKILNFTQPAISSQIKLLEQHYNVDLFQRCNNGVKLTEAGKKFYEYGNKILALYKQMEGELATISGVNKEYINIGASYTAGNYYLADSIITFKESYPNALVRLNISNSNRIIDDIKDCKLDLGIVEGNISYDRDLNICKIGQSELVLIVPATDNWDNRKSITLEEVMQLPFISREDESVLRNYITTCLKTKDVDYDDFNIVMEISNFEAIKHAVINNKGISIVPYSVVERDIQQGNLMRIEVDGFELSWDINVVSRANESLCGLKDKFLNFLINPNGVFIDGPESKMKFV